MVHLQTQLLHWIWVPPVLVRFQKLTTTGLTPITLWTSTMTVFLYRCAVAIWTIHTSILQHLSFDIQQRPLDSICTTTSPPRWIIPKMGGFSFANVPRPGLAFKRLERPSRPFFWLLLADPWSWQLGKAHHIQPRLTRALQVFSPRCPFVVGSSRSCTSSLFKSSSAAIWCVERFKPIKYRQRIHVCKGWWCPAKIVSLKSSNRARQVWHW